MSSNINNNQKGDSAKRIITLPSANPKLSLTGPEASLYNLIAVSIGNSNLSSSSINRVFARIAHDFQRSWVPVGAPLRVSNQSVQKVIKNEPSDLAKSMTKLLSTSSIAKALDEERAVLKEKGKSTPLSLKEKERIAIISKELREEAARQRSQADVAQASQEDLKETSESGSTGILPSGQVKPSAKPEGKE